MKMFKLTLAVLALASVACTAHAETPVPMAASPEEVGLSSVQLKKLEAVTRQQIDDGWCPEPSCWWRGAARFAWVSVQGKRDPAQPDPMKLDSIFRIYSMTKPIVSTTLMQLVEEGRLQISDPVSKYLPEIGNMKVGTEVTGPDGRPGLHLSDPTRPMTCRTCCATPRA
jgi:CubicO group peptidase (beta-lactamase class C family)